MQTRGAGSAALSRLPLADGDVATRPRKRSGARKYITLRQATNIIDAVKFAKSIGLPLVAHLTIHWSLTNVGDDPDGTLFAKVREGLHKWLERRGIELAAVWARERQCRGQSDVAHCHLLFHLPVKYRSGMHLTQVKEAIMRLVELHGRGTFHEKAIDLRVHDNPDDNISSRVVVRRCGRRSGFAKSIAVCRVLFTASGVA